MTRDEFIWKIEHGDDIMFDVLNRHFVIITWPDEGIRIAEQNTSDEGQLFQTAEELVDHFSIGKHIISSVLDSLVITDYTLVKE